MARDPETLKKGIKLNLKFIDPDAMSAERIMTKKLVSDVSEQKAETRPSLIKVMSVAPPPPNTSSEKDFVEKLAARIEEDEAERVKADANNPLKYTVKDGILYKQNKTPAVLQIPRSSEIVPIAKPQEVKWRDEGRVGNFTMLSHGISSRPGPDDLLPTLTNDLIADDHNPPPYPFNTTFETIVGIDDFAIRAHFAGDLMCKIQEGGRFITAYATSMPRPDPSAPQQLDGIVRRVRAPDQHIPKRSTENIPFHEKSREDLDIRTEFWTT
ncbi:unnamed protein product [Nippostrongylus brasiliensis]|uniref:PRP21_like_P domain-containing protein n=1 Tax=Nippostrongylus brasiliensis TaxID=27835 RepID=A0A0N4XDQ8_NIPBR|nr:unnamed protein product [Nippostrongylus brasiliensis]